VEEATSNLGWCVAKFAGLLKMANTDAIEPDVLKWLAVADVETLTKVCAEIPLVIPPEKTGKRTLILKLLMKHLHSDSMEDSDDNGFSTFLKIHSVLEALLGKEKKDENIKIENNFENENLGNIAVHRLREFKINGSIGAVDQKDTLSYTSLSFQMKRGKDSGYGSTEIRAAVIKAIKPGSNLRNYLESKIDLSETAFIKILRSHFKEKDASSVFQEMSNSSQSSSESELDFCLRVMSLRERVMTLSAEEECTFDEVLVRKKFFHTIFTGLRHNSVRMGLQNTLKAAIISDENLLEEISLVVYNESEHLNKQKAKVNSEKTAKCTEINAIGNCLPENKKDKKSKAKENPLLIEIQKLSAKVSQLSSVHVEMEALKKQVANSYRPNNQNNQNSSDFESRRRPFRRRNFRCADCERRNISFCNHCFVCGSTSHRRDACPDNTKNE
jgi:hypothetical protein